MSIYRLKNIKKKKPKVRLFQLFSIAWLCCCFMAKAQVTSQIDSTSIKIGAQITYSIEVEADTSDYIVFPEGQTFLPLEMIASYPSDTTIDQARYRLIKKYALTQFDSGAYTIPKQKIFIADKAFFTDSLKVEVRNILIDTTKQGLYDIKPIIEVEKSSGNFWTYFLYIVLILALVAGVLYWFIWRTKPLTEAEEIALLPPYDRAKLALKKLDESSYLQNAEMKEYYSELTFIIRKYLDEKVYDRALESTTDELVSRLTLLKAGNQIELSTDDIKNIETILKRADLVKFAKSEPDIALAEIDRNTIDVELDQVKEALPEPTEEEKLLDLQYKEELAQRKKRRKIMLTVGIVLLLICGTAAGFMVKYGFDYVKDTVIGHESKVLLEGDWVTSDYGFPPVIISTPKVLQRMVVPLPEELKDKVENTTFGFGSLSERLHITVATTRYKGMESKDIDMNLVIEGSLKSWEKSGVKNIIMNSEKFTTPNGAEGLKTIGTADLPGLLGGQTEAGHFVILNFAAEKVLQQIAITWRQDDVYADQISERIINSLELKPNKD